MREREFMRQMQREERLKQQQLKQQQAYENNIWDQIYPLLRMLAFGAVLDIFFRKSKKEK